MTARERLVVRAFAVWTVYVWGTRIWNIARDETTSLGFKIVHAVLAVVSVAFAVAAWVVVTRVHRRSRAREQGIDATGTSPAGVGPSAP